LETFQSDKTPSGQLLCGLLIKFPLHLLLLLCWP